MKNFVRVLLFLIFATILSFAGSKKIIIDLSKQMAYAYDGKTLVYKGWISSGKTGYETPTGTFKILQKNKDHVSNLYPAKKNQEIKKVGGAKMPYMMRLTWDGIALHAGYTPNRPASHGCIRLTNKMAKKLFKWSRLGTKVIVKGKAPKRVARKNRSFTDYIALAKAKHLKKLKRKKKVYLAKKRRTKKTILAKRAKAKKVNSVKAQRAKIINRYAKFSYRKINRLLNRSYKEKRIILASKKMSRYKKRKELRRIAWLVRALYEAKHQKDMNKNKRYRVKKNTSKIIIRKT